MSECGSPWRLYLQSLLSADSLCPLLDSSCCAVNPVGLRYSSDLSRKLCFLHLWLWRDYHLHAIITVFPLSEVITGFSGENSASSHAFCLYILLPHPQHKHLGWHANWITEDIELHRVLRVHSLNLSKFQRLGVFVCLFVHACVSVYGERERNSPHTVTAKDAGNTTTALKKEGLKTLWD